MAASRTETDASQWEYTTYAPAGEKCSACMKPFKVLERVRRGHMERVSGAPITLYRHLGECPK
ncbi:hypothetical protein ACFYTG_37505 [Streptomyces mirabilis]|uniref:hypothetical protein n=1 Tax=Streptomyces mirabilis TaxID=68239 RepID=UPI0036CF6090